MSTENSQENKVAEVEVEQIRKKFRILTLAQREKRYISKVLKACGGNKAQTAKCLDISVKTLYNKLDAYDMRKKFIKETTKKEVQG